MKPRTRLQKPLSLACSPATTNGVLCKKFFLKDIYQITNSESSRRSNQPIFHQINGILTDSWYRACFRYPPGFWCPAGYLVYIRISGIQPNIWYPAGYQVSSLISVIQPNIWYQAGNLVSIRISSIYPDTWYPSEYPVDIRIYGIQPDIRYQA